jgi:hypothetical protein
MGIESWWFDDGKWEKKDGNSFIASGCYGDSDECEEIWFLGLEKMEINVVKGRRVGTTN